MVPKVCSADLLGFATIFHGIRGYISLIATLKFTYFLSKGIIFVKIVAEFLYLAICLFLLTEYLIKKPPVTMKRVTIILIKVKSCN